MSTKPTGWWRSIFLVLPALVLIVSCAEPERKPLHMPKAKPVAKRYEGAGEGVHKVRWWMSWVDRWVLEIQGLTPDPVDSDGIRERLRKIDAHLAEVEKLDLVEEPEGNVALKEGFAEARATIQKLADVEWGPANRLRNFRELQGSCGSCHGEILGRGGYTLKSELKVEPEVQKQLATPSSESCGTCHPDVLKEWQGTLHATAWSDPIYRAAFKGKEPFRSCRACHSALPILWEEFSADYGYRPRFRDYNHEDSINCMTCHLRKDGTVAASRTVDAPCNPVKDDRIGTVEFCASCHNPSHSAYYAWQESRAAKEGTTCNDCHSQETVRTRVDGSTRKGFSHDWQGGLDTEFVKSALRSDAKIVDGKIVIELENLAAHRLPAEVPSRTIIVEARMVDEAGELIGEQRVDIRRPLKSKVGRADTRLNPDEIRFYKWNVQDEAAKVIVSVLWQPSLMTLRDRWTLMNRWELEVR